LEKSKASVENVNKLPWKLPAKLQEQVMPGAQLEHLKDYGKHRA